ncbi:hypothetical protein B296_00021271 [Ensete ventricosum]|uniref:C2H2-type domain-containing protein n=1 Tax=Ensete ventricosum TaxID=4639 RepID=A0A426ZZ71_ENSVE|nr:hypothetical protein B296_00021271 [Ensete ventricosum]
MASASSSSHFLGGIRDKELQKQMKQQHQQQQQQLQSSSMAPAPAAASDRKRRNQPGNPSKYLKHSNMQNMQEKQLIQAYLPSLSQPNPHVSAADPDAEVIALSPTTLLATNRFICEVCNKGFQREQNLQLHRRGHNLPWKLRQRSSKEVRRRVYLCPEPTCVHHHPSRALGDLTGVKKHFCRKHGEKKWKCDKCSKRYAVQSDLKAHAKTCGTREYRCDCGTLFSRLVTAGKRHGSCRNPAEIHASIFSSNFRLRRMHSSRVTIVSALRHWQVSLFMATLGLKLGKERAGKQISQTRTDFSSLVSVWESYQSCLSSDRRDLSNTSGNQPCNTPSCVRYRRDSFITHRAFCDALAQESSRPPTARLHDLGNHLYGNPTTMASGLSQVNAHLSSLQAQSHSPTDLLRTEGGPRSQLGHLISSSTPSSFRPPQAPPPSAFYLDNGSTQDFNEEHPPHHSLLQSIPFHGLPPQLPDLQRSSTITSSTSAAVTAASVFNLGFFSHNSSSSSTGSIGNRNSGGNQNNQMLMADGFNSANGNTEPATLFSGILISDHVVGGTNSLCNTSMQSDSMLPQMSATALLQKAAQMGVTTSGGPSLLRGFARSSSSRCSFTGGGGDGGSGLQAQTENEAHLQNLMMTLANGGTDLFVGAGGRTAFGGSAIAGGHQQQAGVFGALDAGLCIMDETKFNPSGARNLGGSDQLTRDFLGVGSMVRSINSGITRREPI